MTWSVKNTKTIWKDFKEKRNINSLKDFSGRYHKCGLFQIHFLHFNRIIFVFFFSKMYMIFCWYLTSVYVHVYACHNQAGLGHTFSLYV